MFELGFKRLAHSFWLCITFVIAEGLHMTFWFVWLGFAIVTALAAGSRDRSALGWFFIGLLGGVFALLAVLVMRPGGQTSAPVQIADSWSPGTASGPKGRVISYHMAEMIHEHGDFYWAMGQTFRTIEEATDHIRLEK